MRIDYDDFAKGDIRIGTVTAAAPFPEARKPARDRDQALLGPNHGSL